MPPETTERRLANDAMLALQADRMPLCVRPGDEATFKRVRSEMEARFGVTLEEARRRLDAARPARVELGEAA